MSHNCFHCGFLMDKGDEEWQPECPKCGSYLKPAVGGPYYSKKATIIVVVFLLILIFILI